MYKSDEQFGCEIQKCAQEHKVSLTLEEAISLKRKLSSINAILQIPSEYHNELIRTIQFLQTALDTKCSISLVAKGLYKTKPNLISYPTYKLFIKCLTYQLRYDQYYEEEILHKYDDDDLIEPFSVEELNEMLDTNINEYKKRHEQILSKILQTVVVEYRKKGIFKDKKKFGKEYKTISTDDACFLFDTMRLLEIPFKQHSDNQNKDYDAFDEQDKFQVIRRVLEYTPKVYASD